MEQDDESSLCIRLGHLLPGLKNSNESFLYVPFLYLSFSVLPFCWAQLKPLSPRPYKVTQLDKVIYLDEEERERGIDREREGGPCRGREEVFDKCCICKENVTKWKKNKEMA